MSDLILPYQWTARSHQGDFMSAMLGSDGVKPKKRAVCIWHRRAGKDSSAINFTACQTQQKIANYWHMLPTAVQGRKVVWNAINPTTGVRVIDQAFPPEIRAGINNTEMRIDLKSGSTWEVLGSDNFDANIGANPYGVVFSEYSVADPRAWEFIRPILAENGGWAIFIYTPRGKNHGHDLYEMAQANPNWFCELLTIDDSTKTDPDTGLIIPVVSQEAFQEELDSGMDFQLAQQEFYCSFDAGLFGAYWTEELKQARYGSYPWDPRKPVHTFWDIGVRDANSIIFAQEGTGSAINVIDYREGSNKGIEHWIKILRELPYSYGYHVAPHDIKQRDKFTAISYNEIAESLADFEFEICPNLSMRMQIDAARSFLPRVNFNTDNPDISRLIDCLTNYRREYNDKLRIFMDRPLHDWASHGASSFKYLSIAWNDNFEEMESMQHKVIPAIATSRRKPTKMPRVRRR